MTFIDMEDVEELNARHGPARRVKLEPIRMLEWEFRLLKRSMRNGRGHDATMFLEKNDAPGMYVCIQKPYYKESGIYRAPSGGAEPGERLEDALRREMLEETGLEVDIRGFALIVETSFMSPSGDEEVPWTSYVFYGTDSGGTMETRDPGEIYDVGLFSEDELLGPIAEKMKTSGWGGFLYRETLTRAAFDEMRERRKTKG